MTRIRTTRRARQSGVAVFIALVVVLLAAPASAQYGGIGSLIVEPTFVPIDEAFEYFGTACPPDSTVTISIDGVPGILDTTTANAVTAYQGFDISMPDGLVPGLEYTVRADCAGFSHEATITAMCSGGVLPIDGECPGSVGGVPPTTTTTTVPDDSGELTGVVPDDESDDGPDSGPDAGESGGGDDSGPDDLAITGASYTQIAMQIAVTFMAFGGMILLANSRRRDADAN